LTNLLFMPGGIGELWSALPVIVISMLLISLAEAILILPKHLSRLNGPEWTPSDLVDRFFSPTRGYVDRGLNGFVNGPLDRLLRFATNWPAVVVAALMSVYLRANSVRGAATAK